MQFVLNNVNFEAGDKPDGHFRGCGLIPMKLHNSAASSDNNFFEQCILENMIFSILCLMNGLSKEMHG